jgi:hypothetical protein
MVSKNLIPLIYSGRCLEIREPGYLPFIVT